MLLLLSSVGKTGIVKRDCKNSIHLGWRKFGPDKIRKTLNGLLLVQVSAGILVMITRRNMYVLIKVKGFVSIHRQIRSSSIFKPNFKNNFHDT